MDAIAQYNHHCEQVCLTGHLSNNCQTDWQSKKYSAFSGSKVEGTSHQDLEGGKVRNTRGGFKAQGITKTHKCLSQGLKWSLFSFPDPERRMNTGSLHIGC